MIGQPLPAVPVSMAAPLPTAPPPRTPVQITLQRAPNGYTGIIRSAQVHLPVTDADLAARNAGFATVLDEVRRQTKAKGLTLEEADLLDLLKRDDGLRYQGRLAFETLFPPHSDARHEIEAILAWNEPLTFNILSDGFPFFWEMMYGGGMEDNLGLNALLDGFWGCRHVIARQVIGKGFHGLHPVMRAPAGMLVLVDSGLPQVVSSEVPALQAHATKYNFQCRLLDNVLSAQAGNAPSTQAIIEYLSQTAFPDDLVHFACHARPNQTNTDNSRLEITVDGHKVKVQLADLQVYGLRLARRPFVFLNGCSTNARVLLQSKNFVDEFMRRGARGLIATECTMPDTFAAEFAKEFYGRFLAGALPIGEALWQTRQHFLTEHHNLLGMAYALYADSQTRIVWPE
jgi:hypothetical protein